ncbi:cation efflux protein [Podospora fimiseda]|uniref:Cation efflux protein n=1 Tax=Podospora fimiseda TaxID=252190 RepID=A0AAN7BQX5_9PEZI|nr:cation efflux protein [Podospora fimiseda]
MLFHFGRRQKVSTAIAISFIFFVCEVVVAFKTGSLALLADAFHYLNDLTGFVITLTAIIVSQRTSSPQDLSFGWQRATLLGAFFNGAFLLALAVSIFLQSLERFIEVKPIKDPKLVLIIGCVGLALNLVSGLVLHEFHDHGHGHGHSHGHASSDDHGHETSARVSSDGSSVMTQTASCHSDHRHIVHRSTAPLRDLNMMAAKFHVVSDMLGNVGVIIAALIIWKTELPGRIYADPIVSIIISFVILFTAWILLKNSGAILLQSAPVGVNLVDIKHDLEKIPGIESVHELHVWRLDQQKAIASAHVIISDPDMSHFIDKAKTISECLHAYGIHSTTLQPELALSPSIPTGCQMSCGRGLCEKLTCCSVSVESIS